METCIFSLQLAFGAAILNIHIPLMLGDLVNVVARFLRDQTRSYIQEIKGPALNLLGLYVIQVSKQNNVVKKVKAESHSCFIENDHFSCLCRVC